MIIHRVERHQINKNHLAYKICDELCFKSKNLYNYANYITRQTFIITKRLKENKELNKEQQIFLLEMNKWVDKFNEYKKNNLAKKQSIGKNLDKKFKAMKYFDKDNNICKYAFMDYICKYSEPFMSLGSNSAQYTLKILDKDWKGFLVAIKDYWKNPNKYLGKPRVPNYKNKNGRHICVLTNMQSQIQNGYLYFAIGCLKPCNNLFKTNMQGKHLQTRIIPNGNTYILEIVYEKEIEEVVKESKNIISIDLGLNNFVTITNNIGLKPIIINGRGIKSYNQYWNKEIADFRSLAKTNNGLDWTKKLAQLTTKRNNKIEYFMHSASKWVINYCIKNNIDTIVIGKNDGWKQESKLNKKVNQTFVQIPYDSFIEKLQYKCEDYGINIIVTEECYTSGTSFLDGEKPIKQNYDKSRRVYRGLFVSNNGILINSDVNGSLQIMKKVFPKVANGIVGVDLNPIVINIA